MPLHNPPLKDRPEVISDWVELRTLADSSGAFPLARLQRYWDTKRETESTDTEGKSKSEGFTDEEGISGEDSDKFIDAIADELGERASILGDAYPFEFTSNGNRFKLKEFLGLGGWTYIFCLLFEHHKIGDLWTGSWLPKITHIERDLFQACATLAVAGKIQGCAISFGWPRPDGNPPFRKKLKEVYALFGEGVTRDEILPGASPMVKDEEIDLIAWQPRPDRTAGTVYVLGQVASGDDWTGKSIKGSIDYFHSAWFSTRPPSTPSPAIFIPHAVPPMGEGNRKERMALLTEKFGMIFDRMLMPTMTQAGFSLGLEKRANFLIERMDDSGKIEGWVTQQISDLRGAGAVPL